MGRDLATLLSHGNKLTTIGFDDSPHRRGDKTVSISGVVCHGTRFEGMVHLQATPDGADATAAIAEALTASKFASSVQCVLLDGITFGGLNVVDLPRLYELTRTPVIAVMERLPNLPAMRAAIAHLPEPSTALRNLERAGTIHDLGGFVFQVQGADSLVASKVLAAVTDRGNVPEPLRIAHLIGGALATGTSGKRA